MNPKQRNVWGRRFVCSLQSGCSPARGFCMLPTIAACARAKPKARHRRVQPGDRHRAMHLECGNYTNVSSGKCQSRRQQPCRRLPLHSRKHQLLPRQQRPKLLQPRPRYRETSFRSADREGARGRRQDTGSSTSNRKPEPSCRCTPTPTVVYLIEGGSTRFTLEDGRTIEGAGKTGDVLINAPVTHSQEHTSARTRS